jgi:hypothetical protein
MHAGALGHFLIANAGLVHIQSIARIDVPGPDARLAQSIDEAFDNIGVRNDGEITPLAQRCREVGLDGKFIGRTASGCASMNGWSPKLAVAAPSCPSRPRPGHALEATPTPAAVFRKALRSINPLSA